MSVFDFNGKKINYKVVGEGKPLLILNGIMMSTKSWKPFEKAFTNNDTQLILLDLMDQGESEKYDTEFDQNLQVEVVNSLLNELKINKINIMGTSYGGEVALQFVVKYPNKIDRLILANTVARTNAWLKEIGEAWNLAVENPLAYYSTTIPVIYSPQFYDRKSEWMQERKKMLIDTAFASKDFLDSMIKLTNSANNHDVVDKLPFIKAKTLLIASEQDHITPQEEQRFIANLMPNAELVVLPKTGHASFYERPLLFVSLVMGFLHAEEVNV